jgi:hypothetical protein
MIKPIEVNVYTHSNGGFGVSSLGYRRRLQQSGNSDAGIP